MKIAFTGAGGTGKTTMANYVSAQWGVPYVGSVARGLMHDMGIQGEVAQTDMTCDALYEFQTALLARRREKLAEMPTFVTDRLELDQYAYSLRRCGPALTEEVRKQWEKEAVEELYSMDLVFYTPAGLWPVIADGCRVAETSHQHLMDMMMYGLLCKHAFDRMSGHVYVLSMENPGRRQAYVDALCSEIVSLEA